MPTRKTSTTARPRRAAAKKDEEALMEFENFVSQKPQSNRGKSWLALTFIVIIILLGAAWMFMSKVETMEKDYKFKAIYLDNGQAYYAKVVKEDALNVYLDEVYYIQIEQQLVAAEEEGAEPQAVEVPVLIQRGQELHRPEGLMQVNRSKSY